MTNAIKALYYFVPTNGPKFERVDSPVHLYLKACVICTFILCRFLFCILIALSLLTSKFAYGSQSSGGLCGNVGRDMTVCSAEAAFLFGISMSAETRML